MISNKRIPLDISPLWEDGDIFTLRFRDMHVNLRRRLVQRIKLKSYIRSTTGPKGPPENTIFEILHEINPIIFSEGTYQGGYRSSFGTYQTFHLSGYRFQRLCQAVYWLTMKSISKENPIENQDKITRILYTTCNDWQRVRTLARRTATNINSPTNETPLNCEEVGINEIGQAGGESLDEDIIETIVTSNQNFQRGAIAQRINENDRARGIRMRYDGESNGTEREQGTRERTIIFDEVGTRTVQYTGAVA